MAKNTKPQPSYESSRAERILGFMAVGIISTSVLVMLLTFVVGLVESNENANAFESVSLPTALVAYPQIGLPLGAFCIIAMVAISVARRSKSNR
jgi:hypothetical protein